MIFNPRKIANRIDTNGKTPEYNYRVVLGTLKGREGLMSNKEYDDLIEVIEDSTNKIIEKIKKLKQDEAHGI